MVLDIYKLYYYKKGPKYEIELNLIEFFLD